MADGIQPKHGQGAQRPPLTGCTVRKWSQILQFLILYTSVYVCLKKNLSLISGVFALTYHLHGSFLTMQRVYCSLMLGGRESSLTLTILYIAPHKAAVSNILNVYGMALN